MNQIQNLLPRKLSKEEIALAPISWIRILSNYSRYRSKALRETKPSYYTLLATLSVAIVKRERHLADKVINLTRENMPRHIHLSLIGSALCDLGSRDEGMIMLRDAVKLHPSHSYLLTLAAETDDLDEKEQLSKQVLAENPNDVDALRHLAYAKYFKGEHEEAGALIEKILLEDPNNIYALEDKGNMYFDKETYSDALEQYLKIKLKPIPISLQLKICHCYYLLGMIGKAKRIAKKIQAKVSLINEVENANKLLAEILSS